MNESDIYDIDKQAFQNITDPYDEETPIWRYFTLLDFVSQISENKLYFTNIKHHKDKMEGTLSKPSIEETHKRLLTEDNTPVLKNEEWKKNKTPEEWESKLDSMSESMQEIRADMRSLNRLLQDSIMYLIYTNSWIQDKDENILMWNTYGNQKQDPYTIAIKTTIPKLIGSITNDRDKIHIGKVKYIDYQKEHIYGYDKYSEINFEDTKEILETYYSPTLHKENKYKSENEIRFIISYPFISKTLLGEIYINDIPFFTEFPHQWGISDDNVFYYNNPYFNHEKKHTRIPSFSPIDVDPTDLIQELWLSPYCKEYQEKALMKIIEHLNINSRIVHTW